MKKLVVMGFLGTQLDSGLSPARWEKWRPTVSLAQHEDLVIDRLELFHDVRSTALARQVQADYAQLSPTTEVKLVEMSLADPWDFGEVYTAAVRLDAGLPL
jgi:transcriptional regulatory protein RtcR